MAGPDLLPCPFCGGDASDAGQIQYLIPLSEMKWEDGSPITEGFFCNCPACGVTNNVLGVGYQTQAKAIAAWNRRAPTPLAAALAVPEVRALVEEITHPDFIFGALDNVNDMDVSLDDFARAVSRAQRAALAALKGADHD